VTPDPDNDDFAFWRFEDLKERRIIGSRFDLHRKQELFGFPRPVKLDKGRGATALFPRAAVKEWLRKRLAETDQS
jgi:predicted DNA-binding transcriptional regulator AlpA